MHRTKKMTVTALAATLLMAAGVTSASAARAPKVTICHATGSASNPYVEITISQNAADAHDRHHGERDIIPAPAGGCPDGPGGPGPGPGDGGCNASSSSSNTTGNQTGLVNLGNVNVGLDNLLANLLCQANVLNNPAISIIGDAIAGVTGSGSGDGCNASSSTDNSTGDQTGMVNVGNVNVGLGNAAANLLCQANVLNGPAVSVIGDAIGVVTGSGSGDGCSADSVTVNDTGDQAGLVNLGNLNVDAGNLAAKALCQASVLDGLALSVIGPAFGGSTLGTGLLSSPLGLLSGAPGYLLSGITTDVKVLASVLLQF